MENLSQRKCLDILLVVLLSVIAISQVYESCIKFVKRQTTQSVSLQDEDIVFPSMTICDKKVEFCYSVTKISDMICDVTCHFC